MPGPPGFKVPEDSFCGGSKRWTVPVEAIKNVKRFNAWPYLEDGVQFKCCYASNGVRSRASYHVHLGMASCCSASSATTIRATRSLDHAQ